MPSKNPKWILELSTSFQPLFSTRKSVSIIFRALPVIHRNFPAVVEMLSKKRGDFPKSSSSSPSSIFSVLVHLHFTCVLKWTESVALYKKTKWIYSILLPNSDTCYIQVWKECHRQPEMLCMLGAAQRIKYINYMQSLPLKVFFCSSFTHLGVNSFHLSRASFFACVNQVAVTLTPLNIFWRCAGGIWCPTYDHERSSPTNVLNCKTTFLCLVLFQCHMCPFILTEKPIIWVVWK